MLARALSLSAAEARREMEAVEGGGGNGSSIGAVGSSSGYVACGRSLLPDGSLPPDEIDQKLWAGAAGQGWKIKTRAPNLYFIGNINFGGYRYISPEGREMSSRQSVFKSPEGVQDFAEASRRSGEVEVVAVAAESDDYDEEVEVVGEVEEVEEVEEMEEMQAGEAPAVLQLGRASLVEEASRSAKEIAAAARSRHAEAAAAALAAAAEEGEISEDDEESNGRCTERCMIWGCKQQLLQCFGAKRELGSAIGMAEEAHVVCAPCLARWWAAQSQLYAAKGMRAMVRKVCPCCKCELRSTTETRAEPDRFHSTGLLKVASTW